jgi:cytochrome c-type biogenesis protein
VAETEASASGAATGGKDQLAADAALGDGSPSAAPTTFAVSGMTCSGCADNVEVALSQVRGVGTVEVDPDRGQARVRPADAAQAPDEAELRAAVERIGYGTAAPAPDARQAPEGPQAPESGAPRRHRWAMGALVALALAAGVLAFRSVNAAYGAAGALQQLNAVFDEVSLVAFALAGVIGLVVAFAPSSLAMAPAIMGYVSTSGTSSTRRAGGLSLLFLAGMLLTNMVLGVLFALGGKAVMQAIGSRVWIWYGVVAVLLLAMALILLGVWRPRLPSYRPNIPGLRGKTATERAGRSVLAGRGRAGGAFALGVPFGLMACPACTPLLMPLALGAAATADPLYGAALLGVFGLGRGVPVVLLGTCTSALSAGGSLARGAAVVQRMLGVVLLVAVGYFVWSALWFIGVF